MAIDANHRVTALKVDTTANFGAYMSSLFSAAVPTYLYATLLSGQYNLPAIYANVHAVYTNTAPVDAIVVPAVRKPPICWNARWRRRPVNWGSPRLSCARSTSSASSRTRRRSS